MDLLRNLVLYHGDGTRSVRVRWVLEELHLPYDLRRVRFPPRLRQPSYLQVNPLGSLPTLIEDDLRMTESMAICEYLVATCLPNTLAVAPDEKAYADYRQSCWYGEASLVQPIGTLVQYAILTPPEERPTQVVEAAKMTFARRLEPLNEILSRADYMAADRFTLADVSIGYALDLAAFVGEADHFTPDVSAYRARLAARPAYRRAHSVDADTDAQSAAL